ncbi:MAG: RHS repeat protein [Pseudomonadota bacterium]
MCPALGNPIFPATGVKHQTETDYANSSGLQFTRVYRSDRNGWANNFQVGGIDFNAPPLPVGIPALNSVPDFACYPGIGATTKLPYCFEFTGDRDASGNTKPNDFTVIRGNNRRFNFGTATNLNPPADINDRATKLVDANNVTTGWSVTNASNDATEKYDLSGRLLTSTARNGQVQTMTYTDASTPLSIAPKAGLLLRVTDQFNHQLNFTYDTAGRLKTMTDPAQGLYTYAYDEATSIVLPGKPMVSNLTSVTYPGNKKRLYWYNEQDKTGNTDLPFALTGITDENGVRFATWNYNAQGLAISGEHAGGVEKTTITYPSPNYQATAIDPLGTSRTYNFTTILGVVKFTGQSQPGGAGCGAASNGITYDANGNIATRTDFNNVVTKYTYDLSRNLETSRNEAFGKPEAKTTSTTWHTSYRLPLKIAEPLRLTTMTYDAKGNLLTKKVQATTDTSGALAFTATLTDTARTTTYTYNSVGQVLTVNGPRTDVTDLTTYTYDPVNGNLLTITNAANQVTTLSNYDANGRAGRIVDANNLTTDLLYSPRGWLLSRTVTGTGIAETTLYQYDDVGQLKKVTLPDNAVINYTYDDAHRLTDVADGLGNKIHYTLDAIGNRTKEEVKDVNGVLARQTSRVFDALNRLQQVTGGAQ